MVGEVQIYLKRDFLRIQKGDSPGPRAEIFKTPLIELEQKSRSTESLGYGWPRIFSHMLLEFYPVTFMSTCDYYENRSVVKECILMFDSLDKLAHIKYCK